MADVASGIETVKPAVYREIDGLEFETVPAYNTLKPFHPKSAEWVGYVLRIDGKRIYIHRCTCMVGRLADDHVYLL